ncbi:uncharacterized protein [Lolium perenne]|uniref:uncharacterized protein n=1 Tax=Lolium perenne TaxID=4522 RepID=UPI0021F68367|nr:uncharacterized protein LOC127308166 [Lolium perenne]
MASQQHSPAAKKKKKKSPSLPPTTISGLDQDILHEIFVRLPSLPSLVRAAFTCHTFLDAVRSSPAFRRRFRALHCSPVLGHFIDNQELTLIPNFLPLRRRSDPDLGAVLRGADFFLTRLPDDDDAFRGWSIHDCRDGFLVLGNWSADQMAVYNPLTRTMDLFPLPPREDFDPDGLYFDFHILPSEEDHRSFRLVCVRHGEIGARALVLSSDTSKWQNFPWVRINGFWPENGTMVNGCIYWTTGVPNDARVLNTATMHFSRIHLPPRRANTTWKAGETKDGRLCMACVPLEVQAQRPLDVWFWRADGDGVERWMLDKSLPMQELAEIVQCHIDDDNARVQLNAVAIIDGFIYLSVHCGRWQHHHPTFWFLSFCLETGVLNKLGRVLGAASHPYIMPWPRSLVHNKLSSSSS